MIPFKKDLEISTEWMQYLFNKNNYNSKSDKRCVHNRYLYLALDKSHRILLELVQVSAEERHIH